MNNTRRNSLVFLASLLLVGLIFLARQVGQAELQAAAARPAPMAEAAEAESPVRSTAAPAVTPHAAQPATAAPAAQNRRPASGAERGVALAAKIRATPTTGGAWTNDARKVLDGVQDVGNFECHDEGCIATVTYADELAFEVGDESLTKSSAFQAYGGWRHRSFEKQASGQVVATWYFMNPARS